MGKTWSEEEVNYLRDNYQEMTAEEIGEELGRSRSSITNKVDRLGLEKGYGDRDWLSNNFDKEPSEDLAYILGVIKGDGYVGEYVHNGCHHCKIELNTIDKTFAESFSGSLENIGLNPNIWLSKEKNREDQWRLSASSKNFYEWYSELSFDDIDNLLMNDEMKKEFIRGFYESEGNSRPKYRSIRMFSTDKELINFVQKLTKELGFKFSLKQENSKKEYYKLIIYKKEERIDFLREIDPVIYRKSLQRLLNFEKEKQEKTEKLEKYGQLYSGKEKRFIIDNHQKYSLTELAEELGRTRGSVSGMKSKLLKKE